MKAEWFKRWEDDRDDREYVDTKGYYGEEEEEEEKSGWWSKFHGDDKKKSSYTPVKSTSAYLRSSFSSSGRTSSDCREDLLEILKEVNKTINLTQNSEDGKTENTLSVRYTDGYSVNDLLAKVLFIDPALMMTKGGSVLSKSSDEYYSALDALNGQAMLCSFMKKSVSRKANNEYSQSDNWATRNIYMTDLQTTAGNEIRSDWPGFQSYIDQQQQVFQIGKDSIVQSFLQPQQNIDNFIDLICYNRLSKDRIDYNVLFEKEIADRVAAAEKLLNDTLDQPCSNDERFIRAKSIYSDIQNIMDLQLPPPPPQPESGDDQDDSQPQGKGNSGGTGDDEQDSDSDGDEDSDEDSDDEEDSDDDSDSDSDGEEDNSDSQMKIDSIDTSSNSSRRRRFTGDNSYNGKEIVTEQPQHGSIDPNEELRDRVKHESDQIHNFKDVQLENVYYNKIIPAVNTSTREQYKSFVASNRRTINSVKDCFAFHNTDAGVYSHGLTSGSIDENNFHKVFMGETDRLYERKDIMTRKKWLVSLLIDQSGSMCHGSGSYQSSRIKQARELAIVFSEALKSLNDLDFSVYGFSTEFNRIDTFTYKDKTVNKLDALIEADHHEGTGIGFHIAHVGDKIVSQYGDYDNKILFVITDGEPNCSPTPTMDGYEHTAHCCNLLRKNGIQVFGIGIANAFGAEKGERLFGANNYVVINDVQSTLSILTKRLKTYLQRMQK